MARAVAAMEIAKTCRGSGSLRSSLCSMYSRCSSFAVRSCRVHMVVYIGATVELMSASAALRRTCLRLRSEYSECGIWRPTAQTQSTNHAGPKNRPVRRQGAARPSCSGRREAASHLINVKHEPTRDICHLAKHLRSDVPWPVSTRKAIAFVSSRAPSMIPLPPPCLGLPACGIDPCWSDDVDTVRRHRRRT